MASTRAIFVVLSIVAIAAVAEAGNPTLKEWKQGRADDAADKNAKAADQSKMGAVDKVITMLEDLREHVLSEGEEEARTYNKFACFCKTAQAKTSSEIVTDKEDRASLSAEIVKLGKQRDNLDDQLGDLQATIKKATVEMKKATRTHEKALALFKTNSDDMKAAIVSLEEAITNLKSSKITGLVQIQAMAQTLKQAVLLADALGLGGDATAKSSSLFLQQSSGDVPVEMEDYKFHSGGIIETLEKLQGDFRKQRNQLDADEVQRRQEYDMFMQDRTDLVKLKMHETNVAKKARDHKKSQLGEAQQQFTTWNAEFLDDMQYLDEVNSICSAKAKTWDQRSKLRSNELTALTQATGIVKATVATKTSSSTMRLAQAGATVRLADAVVSSDFAMEAIEAEAESSEADDDAVPAGFLQKKAVKNHKPENAARQLIISLLKAKGQQLHSAALSTLASQVSTDPLAKVKKLIQELVERLLTEAANEANQKGWCDKAVADATQKRDYAAEDIEDLNTNMARLEALSAQLKEELSELSAQTQQLKTNVADAEKDRKAEKTENAVSVKEAGQGLTAVNSAISLLEKFYKTAAKEDVGLEFMQGQPEMPETTFKAGEAYTGSSAEAGGIVGMMEVIRSDFERTIVETRKAEDEAEKQHLDFMTESGKSLAEKKVATEEKTSLKDEADQSLSDASDELDAQTKILKTSLAELMELHPTCIDNGPTYADRIAKREQEIASLKKSLCILSAMADFGPDGLADAC